MSQQQLSDDALITTDVQTPNSVRTDPPEKSVLEAVDLDVYYGEDQALADVSIEIPRERITAILGPSGCGKSTFLRCINRMNDRIDACRVDGELGFRGRTSTMTTSIPSR